jgi:hypothetical protein
MATASRSRGPDLRAIDVAELAWVTYKATIYNYVLRHRCNPQYGVRDKDIGANQDIWWAACEMELFERHGPKMRNELDHGRRDK